MKSFFLNLSTGQKPSYTTKINKHTYTYKTSYKHTYKQLAMYKCSRMSRGNPEDYQEPTHPYHYGLCLTWKAYEKEKKKKRRKKPTLPTLP